MTVSGGMEEGTENERKNGEIELVKDDDDVDEDNDDWDEDAAATPDSSADAADDDIDDDTDAVCGSEVTLGGTATTGGCLLPRCTTEVCDRLMI